jgi:pimeloyl-ACP methyl ester carboxylesterase
MGHEYARSHRVLRHLALALADAGCHVLRFDWFGTGDSGGEPDAAEIRGWIGDVGTAIDELKDTAGVSRVSLVGVRLGASLALTAAATRRDVESAVLWDPVVSGANYLTELRLLNEQFLGHEYPRPKVPHEDEDIDGILGQMWPRALRDALSRFSLESLTACGVRAVHILSPSPGLHAGTLATLEKLGVRVTIESCPDAEWNTATRVVAALLPHQMKDTLNEMTAATLAGVA